MSKATYQLNKEIEQFVNDRYKLGDLNFSPQEIAYLNRYVGYGGLWKWDIDLPKERGLYEYYTPSLIIQKMVGLAKKHGYISGPVLEPSCGVGRILHYFPPGHPVTAYEPDLTSYLIAKANFKNSSFEIINSTFNEVFVDRRGNTKPWEAKYKLVIGNPPYGAFRGRFTAYERGETKATTYVEYFITRGLDLLLPGGILVYVVPSAYLDGSANAVKENIHKKGELVDAYRLPKRMFSQTDIQTDIIVYKKAG